MWKEIEDRSLVDEAGYCLTDERSNKENNPSDSDCSGGYTEEEAADSTLRNLSEEVQAITALRNRLAQHSDGEDATPFRFWRRHVGREQVLGHMMQCTDKIRIVVGPASFGKTLLVKQYCGLVAPQRPIIWIEAHRAAFMADLTYEKAGLLPEGKNAKQGIVVFDGVPRLRSLHKERFTQIAQNCLKQGYEVLITSRYEQSIDSFMDDAYFIDARQLTDISLSKENCDHLRIYNPAEPENPGSILPMSLDARKHCAKITAALIREPITSLPEALVIVALVLQRGNVGHLERVMGLKLGHLAPELHYRYPHMGLNPYGTQFRAMLLSQEDRCALIDRHLSSLTAFRSNHSLNELANVMVKLLIAQGEYSMAAQMLAQVGSKRKCRRFLQAFGQATYRAGYPVTVLALVALVGPEDLTTRDFILAQRCAAMTGLESANSWAMEHARNSASTPKELLLVELAVRADCAGLRKIRRSTQTFGRRVEQQIGSLVPEALLDRVALMDVEELPLALVGLYERDMMAAFSLLDDLLDVGVHAKIVLECLTVLLGVAASDYEKGKAVEKVVGIDTVQRILKRILSQRSLKNTPDLNELLIDRLVRKVYKRVLPTAAQPEMQLRASLLEKRRSRDMERWISGLPKRWRGSFVIAPGDPEADLRVFGGFTLRISRMGTMEEVPLRDKAKLLIAYIAISRNRRIGKEHVLRSLWPNSSDENIRQNFYSLWSYMTRLLGGKDGRCQYVEKNATVVKLVIDQVRTDINQLEHICNAIEGGEVLDLRGTVVRMRELYKGELLPGFSEPEIETARNAWRYRMNQCLQAIAERAQDSGDIRLALDSLAFAAEIDPGNEATCYMRASVYMRQHQEFAAMECIQAHREYSREQYGSNISHRLDSLYAHLLELTA